MSENESRLIKCFECVFPGLTPDDIRLTSAASAGSWDSLSAVTIAAVVQEQFRLQIDPRVLPDMDSFDAFRAYLRRQNPAGE